MFIKLLNMDFEKQYKEITNDIDHESFDSLMSGFEKLLDLLESSNETDVPSELIEKAVKKAEEIKAEAAELLKKERQDILAACNRFGIDPDEVGMK